MRKRMFQCSLSGSNHHAGMAFLCFIYLTLCGPFGIHSDITTVSKISVKTKDSISIPCHYDLYHKEQVKYLCQGRYFYRCKVVVRSTQTETESSRFLIADDTNQGTFTVTINDVRNSDSHFWCAAEVNGGRDDKRYFQLIVTAGTPHLYVDQQEIAAIESGNVTIMCHYKGNKLPQWCRQDSTCVTDASGVIDGVKVNTDLSVPNVFTVIMSELKITSNGWYWCATGDLQMPVHVSVGKMPTKTTAELSTMRSTTAGTILTSQRSSSPAQSTNSSGEGQETLQDNHQRVLFTSAMGCTLLSLLFIQLLVIIAVIFGWRMRHYKTKCKDPSIAASPQTGGHELFYSEIVHNRHAGSKKDRAPKESVIYSTISGRSKQMSKPANEDVVYSTVGPH